MRLNKKFILAISAMVCASTLSSCALVYKPDMQQGNIVTSRDLAKLHRGMSKFAVESQLGSPVDTQVFRNNKETYVYFLESRKRGTSKKHLIITFYNGKVSSWVSTFK